MCVCVCMCMCVCVYSVCACMSACACVCVRACGTQQEGLVCLPVAPQEGGEDLLPDQRAVEDRPPGLKHLQESKGVHQSGAWGGSETQVERQVDTQGQTDSQVKRQVDIQRHRQVKLDR